MYRQTPRKVALSTSSAELNHNFKNQAPLSSKLERTQFHSVGSWVGTNDQEENHATTSSHGLKRTGLMERSALGVVSNTHIPSISVSVFKDSLGDLPGSLECATPALKQKGKSGRTISVYSDRTPKSVSSDASLLRCGVPQFSIQKENFVRLPSTEEDYEDVFSQGSPVPGSVLESEDWNREPEIHRRSENTEYSDNYILDDFLRPFTADRDLDEEPETMYLPDLPMEYPHQVLTEDDVYFLETMIRCDPEAPSPVQEKIPVANWWEVFKPEPLSSFDDSLDPYEYEQDMSHELDVSEEEFAISEDELNLALDLDLD